MKMRHLPALAALLVTAVATLPAQTAEAWIAKARTFLGGDKALDAVKSIHFTGTLELADGTRMPVDIVFQWSDKQRIIVKGAKLIETTALDGYDAWQKRTNPDNPEQWQVTLLDANQIRRLRANTLENLSFYDFRKMKFCDVFLAGEAKADGVDCVKLTYHHIGNVIFVRYFNKATGRLVKTETENGGEIREEGEMLVNGIRFPKRVINKAAGGNVTSITFEQVAVNEIFPAEAFAVPSLQVR